MATLTWIGTTTNFALATNWSPAQIPTSADDLVFNNNKDCVAPLASSTVNSIDFNGYTGSFTSFSSGTITISGSNTGTTTGISLRLSSGMNISGFITSINFTSSVGGYIYCNGNTFACPIVFNNATGVWSNQDALNSSSRLTITAGTLTAGASITTTLASGTAFAFTAGTLNLGSYTHNFYAFSCSNANTRTINFGTCTINLTGNNNTIWTTATITGLTVSGTPTINLTYSGSVGSRVVSTGALPEASVLSFNITAGTDTFGFPASNAIKNLNFTGFSGIYNCNNALNIYGNLTLSSSQTTSGTSGITFLGTSTTQIITSNGVTISFPITINSATTTIQNSGALTTTAALTLTTGTLNINADLTIGSASAFTFTAGTINANNGANITCGTFVSSAANTRTLNMGSGTWNLTSTGTVWNVLATSLTFSAEQSRIVMTNISATACTFAGGGLTYYTVELAKGSSTAITTISGNNTFANFIDNTSTAAHTISILGLTTQSFYRFNVRGTAGALVTVNRNGTGTTTLTKVGKGIVCYCDYITLGTLTGTPASTWYIGANSSIGTSTGFIATAAPSSQSTLGVGGVG